MEEAVNHSSELLEAIGWIISSGWTALTSIKVPGLGISFATLFIGLFLAELGLRFLFMILGVSFGHEDVARGEDSGILKRKDKPGKIGF